MVLISCCTSWSWPSACDSFLFLSLREENRLTLLRGSEAMSSEKTAPEPLLAGRDTCCNRKGRSEPAPHRSAPTDSRESCLPLLESAATELDRELRSETGRCFLRPSPLVLLVERTDTSSPKAQWMWNLFSQIREIRATAHFYISNKHCDGCAGGVGRAEYPPEDIGEKLEGGGLAVGCFLVLARVCLRFICHPLCCYLIKHQRTGKSCST